MAYISAAAIINSILPKVNPVNMEMCPIHIATGLLIIHEMRFVNTEGA